MSDYQVIARKFRPHTFQDVVGQHHVTQTLQNAIKLDRIGHAFLFTGTRGCGKTSTARIFAKALNCTSGDGPQVEPCNTCENCKEITGGGSLDVLEIDGASNNGVENIRELRENVRFLPNSGRFKVYIIDEAHMLSQAAWNALLKTLEEPPSHVIFIFATTEPQKIPQTILSRVQRFDFKRIPVRAIRERLEQICTAENIEVGGTGLASVARAADGSLRDAQSLLDQLVAFAGKKIAAKDVTQALGLIDRTLVTDAMGALAARDSSAVLSVAARVSDAGHDAEAFARALLRRLRDLMVVKVVDDPARLLEATAEEIALLQERADAFTREEIDALFSILSTALEDLRNESPYLALEMALLRMTAIEPVAPLADLVERVEALAGGHAPARPRVSTSSGSQGSATGGGSGGASKPRLGKPTFLEDEGRKQKSLARQERVGRNPADPPAPSDATPEAAAPAPAATPEAAASAPEAATPESAAPADEPDAAPAASPSAPAASPSAPATSPSAPATSPPAPAANTSAALDWEALVAYVRPRAGLLGTYLANDAWCESFDGETLTVGVRKDSMSETNLSDRDRQVELEGLLESFAGRKIQVRVVPLEASARPSTSAAPPPPTAAKRGSRQEHQAVERKQLREEALNDPRIADAMSTLDAELAEVRPLRGPTKN